MMVGLMGRRVKNAKKPKLLTRYCTRDDRHSG